MILQAIKSPLRFNKRCFVLFQGLILVISLLTVVNSPRDMAGDVCVYMGLWTIISSACLIFTVYGSYSAGCGRAIDIFEIPIYLSVTQMFLISLLGLPKIKKK